jgi:sec-independent protein translocase protein TatA
MNILAFGGPYDMVLIFLVILVLFGAKKLPDLAKGLGQAMREFHKAKDEIEREINKPATELTVQPVAQQPQNPPAPAQPAAAPATPTTPTTPTV